MAGAASAREAPLEKRPLFCYNPYILGKEVRDDALHCFRSMQSHLG